MDYIVDKDTLQYKRGVNTHRIEKRNILVFERNLRIEENSNTVSCHNCGAPLDIHYTGVCSYCKSIIFNQKTA